MCFIILLPYLSNLNNYDHVQHRFSHASPFVSAEDISATFATTTYNTPTERYLDKLKFRRLVREYSVKNLQTYDNYIQDTQKQMRYANIQKKAVQYAASRALPVSTKAFEAALLRTQKQMQMLANTNRDTILTRNASQLLISKKLDYTTNELIGIENYIRTSTVPQALTQPVMASSNLFLNMDKASFSKTLLNTNTERTFACSGDYFGLYLDPFTSGKIISFGKAALGRTNTNQAALPVDLTLQDGEYVKQLACGGSHALVLTTKAIYAWGSNDYRQVNDSAVTLIPTPQLIVSHSNTINFVGAGPYNSVYITTNGLAYIWGRGTYYQLGLGSNVDYNIGTPTYVYNYGSPFTKICFGLYHTIGMDTNGQLYYWGSRSYQSSDYKIIPGTSSSPSAFSGTFFSQNYGSIVDFQCGDLSTMILINSGRVYSFGYNSGGTLGDGTSTDTTDPVATLVSSTNDNAIKPSTRISLIRHKYKQIYAVTEDQQMVGWGNNPNCVLGVRGCISKDSTGACKIFDTNCPSTLNVPTFAYPAYCEQILDVLVMREAAIILCVGNYTLQLKATGNLFSPIFPNNPDTSMYLNGYLPIYQFPLMYLTPHERRYATFENSAVKIVQVESQPLTTSALYTEVVLVDKKLLPNQVNFTGFTNMFKAFSFYNTHDFLFNDTMWYFGGFVNNTPSDRIMAIPVSCPYCTKVYNEPLPYPIAAGSATIVDDYLYIFGGVTIDREVPTLTTKVMRAQLDNLLKWETVKILNLPYPVFDGIATMLNEKIYLFGGRRNPKSQHSDILYASLSDNQWVNSNQIFPYPFTGSQFVHDSSYFYIFGGTDTYYQSYNQIIRAKKSNPLSWESVPQTLGPITLGNANLLINNTSIYYLAVDNSFAPQTKLYFNIISLAFKTTQNKKLSILETSYIYLDGLRTCQHYVDELGSSVVLPSGTYWIKPVSTVPKFAVYCDMTFLGGGWSLIASRGISSKPVYTSGIVGGSYDGASLTDQRWSALRSQSIDIMIQENVNLYSITSLASVTSVRGTPLSNDLTAPQLFYTETDGLWNGGDQCYFGGSYYTEITKRCSHIPYKVWTFTVYDTYRPPQINIYVR